MYVILEKKYTNRSSRVDFRKDIGFYFTLITSDFTGSHKINRGYLLVMTNQPTAFEVPVSKCSQVIDWKPFALPTDRPTDMYKSI